MKNDVNSLVEYLKECDQAYYNSDSPLVSNDTYDALVNSVKRMAPDHPYLNKVGAEATGTNKVGRVVPMGTLSKYHEESEVEKWLSTEQVNGEDTILLCPKYDGFGVELVYENGVLSMASTRGDGYVGEDILESIKQINIPWELPPQYRDLVMVRGEAIIPRENHEDVKKLGYTAMRNAVPGIVKSGNMDALPYVSFVAYEFFDGTADRVKQREKYSEVFEVEDLCTFSVRDFNSILDCRNWMGSQKDTFKYEIDGIVLKSNTVREDELLCPTHQIAWKFKSNRRETILRGIEYAVGVTGNISVVAIFDPVEFQGAKLGRASLGSLQRCNQLKPTIGCTVSVSRRGDIIPMVEEVLDTVGEYEEITVCPCCGTLLENYRCPNKFCDEKVRLRVVNYVGSLGVKGIGGSLVSKLVDGGYLTDIHSVYTLDADIIATLPRQGQSAVEKWKTLQNKELTTLQFLTAYPFDNIGEAVWTALLKDYTVKDLLTSDLSILESMEIKGIGPSKRNAIISQLRENQDDIRRTMIVLGLYNEG